MVSVFKVKNKDARVRTIFSDMIHENLETSFNWQGVKGSPVSSPIGSLWGKPPKILAKMLSKCKKTVYSLTLFGARYKRTGKLESVNGNFMVSLKSNTPTKGKF